MFKCNQKIHTAIPHKQPQLQWYYENNLVVIKIKKRFTKIELFINKFLKGPEYVKLRLDVFGSSIWELCDGNNTTKDICIKMLEKYKEDIEPVEDRVIGFIVKLLRRGVIYF